MLNEKRSQPMFESEEQLNSESGEPEYSISEDEKSVTELRREIAELKQLIKKQHNANSTNITEKQLFVQKKVSYCTYQY